MFRVLTDEQRAIQHLAREFAEKRLSKIEREDDAKRVFRREVVAEMGRLGLLGAILPEEYGGSNASFLSAVLVIEELARVSASYSMLSASQAVGPGLLIVKYGTKEQKDNYLRPLANGDILACMGITEPHAGSDLASISMTATKMDNWYALNGIKVWITNGPVADVGLFWARTGESQPSKEGISCFIIDLKITTGISVATYEQLGLWCSVQGKIVFEDARVSGDCLLGPEGEGYHMLTEMLNSTRLCAAARALGVSQACLEDSIRYAKSRKQFDQAIGNFQMIQSQIAEIYIELEAARSLVYLVASNWDRGIQDAVGLAAAKVYASEVGVKVSDIALQIHGAQGFLMNLPVQRYVRDSRAFPITEGTSNILKIMIARNLLKT